MSTKPTPEELEELGKNLADLADDARLVDEAKRLPTRTKKDVEAETAKGGHDRERARALGLRAKEAFAKAAAKANEGAPPPSNVVPIASRRAYRWAVPAAIAASFAAAIGIEGQAIVAWVDQLGNTMVAGGKDAASEADHARRLRAYAVEDCETGRYDLCAKKLDEAKGIDPQGEMDPEVQKLRARLAAAADAAGPGD